jgi:hypothetical protein
VREVGGRLADELGVDAEKVVLKPGDETKIWKDGDQIQARYAPGTDPESALAAWKADAKKAKIGKPKKGQGHGHDHGHPREPLPTERPRTPADHETVSETAKVEPELAEGGHSAAKETTAAAVPGSEFTGHARAVGGADAAAQVTADAHVAFEGAALLFHEVKSVERASSKTVIAGPGAGEERVRLDNTHVLHMQDGTAFTVRVTSGPLPNDAVARTVVNTTKVGATAVERGGNVQNVQVEGRYVIQLNERMDPINADRAIAHEIGEILAERDLAKGKKIAGPDVLQQGGVPGADATLSPHDRGRLGEIKSRAQAVNNGDATARREMLALVEELGLREGTVGSAERRHLVMEALDGDSASVSAIEWASQPETHLEPDAKAQLDTVRRGRQEYADKQAAAADAATPIHEMPDARPPPGERISPERARELALEAAVARANKSAETLASLRAQAHGLPPGERVKIQGDVQIGGGAALAARDPNALLVDARGRWQADASDRIAQTANQLKGLKDAGIGDPFQFAEPNERVPMSAVKYWEDSIAAQGPVIDGEVTRVAIDDHGKTILTIKPKDGPAIEVEVEGNISTATGFPVERLPGTPREMTPDKAVDQVTAVLKGIVEDPHAGRKKKARARAALREISEGGFTGLETRPGQREHDMSEVKKVLKNHHLEQVVEQQAGDATKMLEAGAKWDDLTEKHPDTMVLGDFANLEQMDANATDKWIIGGLGGTGISAAEIVLAKNPDSHVTMVGDKPPAGLIENDQFMAVLKAHADAQTADKLNRMYGMSLTPGDGRFSLVFDVKVETPTVDRGGTVRARGQGKSPDFVPEGYDATTNPMVGGGYISAIGRENQLPPIVAALKDSVEARGGRVTMEPKYNSTGQYTHYEVTAWGAPDAAGVASKLQTIDVTGAASRFPPWELFAGDASALDGAKTRFWAANDLDAPPESGNFDGGFVSSATQAARYARSNQ